MSYFLYGLSLRNIGGIAAVVGAAGSFLYDPRWRREFHASVKADTVTVCVEGEPAPCCPGPQPRGNPPCLLLRQVIVAMCPGVCTPTYTLDGFKKATYEEELATRHHYATLFPFRKLSRSDPSGKGQPEWSNYEKLLQCQTLPGGSTPGQLSSYGQEQMYCLGLSLKNDYIDALALRGFDPDKVSITSANVKRSVDSARCVMAGMFGKKHLHQSAQAGKPVEITIEDCDKLNILTPVTEDNCMLQKINLAAKNLHGEPPDMTVDRDSLEQRINEQEAKRLEAVTDAQERYEKLLRDRELVSDDPNKGKTLAINQDRQLYLHDERIDAILAERHDAIDQVELFWHNVFSNHDFLSEQISQEDFQALTYLRRIEIEDFALKFQKGVRYKFYFDTNPYFHNKVLTKEIYAEGDSTDVTSWSTPIQWKPCFRLHPMNLGPCKARLGPSDKESCDVCGGCKGLVKLDDLGKAKKKSCVCADGAKGPSFFAWFVEQNDQFEPLGVIIKHDAWMNPFEYYTPKSYSLNEDNDKPSLDFLAMRDDVTSRHAHGYLYPKALWPLKGLAEENAARILYYATTGQHTCDRTLITKLTAGRLLNDVMKTMTAYKCEGGPSLKLYSIPHGMMAAMLECLGIWNFRYPPPSSDLRIELLEDLDSDGDFYVRVLHQGKVMMCRGQCTGLVHLTKLSRTVKPYVATQVDWETMLGVAAKVLKRTEKCYEVPDDKRCKPEEMQKLAEVPAGM